jgi:hypothetical protein
MCDCCKDIARAQLEIVDNTLAAVFDIHPIAKKGKKYALPFEPRFVELLFSEWGKATSGAVKKALKILSLRTGDVSDREVDAALNEVQKHIDKEFPAGVSPTLPDLITKSYKRGRDPIFRKHQLKAIWAKPDIEAIDWLTDHHMYWIGGYYDKRVSGAIAETIAEGMKQGLSRKDIGKTLKEFFDDYPGVGHKPDTYWRGLAANGMNRSRNFGLVGGYEEVGVTVLVTLVVVDKRTSDICLAMVGREIPVAKAARQRDRMMEAKDPEDIKDIARWPTLDEIKGKADSTVLRAGIIMPPYHFHCRTTVVEK